MPSPRKPKLKNQLSLNIYDHLDYKDFLRRLIETYPNSGRGIRKSLAEAIRCQVAYISHVLAGDSHFNLEQAESAARFFGFSREEVEFFVLLVSRNRAGTWELREFFDRMLGDRIRLHQQLKARVKINETLDQTARVIYYSHWHYAAIHMMLTIPELTTRDSIVNRVKLPQRKVQQILDFLVSSGIVSKEGLHYFPKGSVFHLENSSPHTSRHHTNLRLSAIASFSDEKPSDLHYSGFVTCSESELPKVRERIAQCLGECMELIKPSKEEKLAGLCLDWFEV